MLVLVGLCGITAVLTVSYFGGDDSIGGNHKSESAWKKSTGRID